MDYRVLKKKYPSFVFEKYSWKVLKGNLNISFIFKIGTDITFKPKVVIKNVNSNRVNRLGNEIINNLVFQLGLIELLSYWKATCSPQIRIEAGKLNREQILWWKDLIIKGMGQFFYENKISFKERGFLKISATKKDRFLRKHYKGRFKRKRTLVPVGGGKDSVVTLELLKKNKKEIVCFSLNPIKASKETMWLAGFKRPIIVRRKIDKKLLELNKKGFLNGHTPFSAYLAFLSVLVALLFDCKFIAFSNERSSNEGNVKYLGKIINHQYSKSFDFEKKFRNYSRKYLAKNIEYFSFLRPLYEIQISRIFSRFSKYFPVFLSCNEAQKTYSAKRKPLKKWCLNCPKCFFVFISLYPFLEKKQILKIFGKNLFEDKKLLPLMEELIGEKRFKPFECVGTKKESLVALYLNLKKEKKKPYLLKYFEKKILPKYKNLDKEAVKLINSRNKNHCLPKNFERINLLTIAL